MSVLTQLADAIAAELKNGDFPIDFTPERAWTPISEASQLGSLRVFVIPGARESELVGRDVNDKTFTVAIVVEQQVDGTPATIDPLDDLVEAIFDFFDNLDSPTAGPPALIVGVENEEAALVEELCEQQLFVSVVLVRLQVEDGDE